MNNGTPNPDQRAAMVNDALAALSHDFKPMTLSAAQLLMERAMDVTKQVAELVKPMLDNPAAFGKQHDVKVLAHVISKGYTERLSTWSKDELLYLVVLMHTDNAIEHITGETNSSKIIKL